MKSFFFLLLLTGVCFWPVSCVDCEGLKDVWDELAAEWEGHKVGVIAKTDCADDQGFALCHYFNVEVCP